MTQTVQNNYKLSIRFAPDGFYLSVYEDNLKLTTKKVEAEFSQLAENQIIDLLEKQPELQNSYKSVRLIYQTRIYTYVPVAFFNETEITDVLKFQHRDLNGNEKVVYNRLEPWEAVSVFSVPGNLESVLKRFLPEIEIEHHLSALMKDHVMMRNGKSLYAMIRNNEVDIIVLHDNKLLLLNTYEFESLDDIVYHILNVTVLLKLGTDECQLMLLGNGNLMAAKELMTKYFQTCNSTELFY